MSAFTSETVLSVHHWTDHLFSFSTTRPAALRFASGQFTMTGLEVAGRPLLRAYSIASAHHEEQLEFFSIKVPDGALTSRLQGIRPGDAVLVGRKPTGTLVVDYLLPGRRLFLLATGTGLAPFLSIVRDPHTYERFEQVIVVHGVRHVADLAYRKLLTQTLPQDEWLGYLVRGRLLYFPCVTREPFVHRGRVTELLASGALPGALGLPRLAPPEDRVMVCGSQAMLAELKTTLEARGFDEGSTTRPGRYVIERAFVES
jgi:ferredoxin--NADP+ reductase